MTTGPGAQRTAITRVLDDDRELLDMLPDTDGALAWVYGGDGIVGWGVLARYEPAGPTRFADARAWWDGFVAGTRVRDEVGLPGTGPVAFTSIAFSANPGSSVIVVPRVLVGRRAGTTWITCYDDEPATPEVPPRPGAPRGVRYTEGQLPAAGYRDAVAAAVARIRAGELHKVVLAHDQLAVADAPIDARFLLRALAARYPTCWAFSVAGLVGATPELLLRKHGQAVSALLLAGTVWPGSDSGSLSSAKNRAEHRYGVDSIAASLGPWCEALSVPDEPSVLRLHNVAHLATEVSGTLDPGTSLLRLTEDVHPTAAVGGTPRDAAVDMIGELEHMDRGRYAGPVGWLDAAGDGELGIALRCAQLDSAQARLFAGGGIVAGSDPDTEVAEADAKFLPIREALGTADS